LKAFPPAAASTNQVSFSILLAVEVAQVTDRFEPVLQHTLQRQGFVCARHMKMICAALLAAGAVIVMRSVYNLPTQFPHRDASIRMQRFRPGKSESVCPFVAIPAAKDRIAVFAVFQLEMRA